MRRLLVYSHDTYGLGNLRRMLAICDHLIDGIHDLSILLVTGFYDVAIQLYDLVLVLGSPQLFDLTHEYDFPAKLAEKTRFCGYMRRQNGRRKLHQIRHDLGLGQNEKLVVVTAGGGQDGFRLLSTYITGTKTVAPEQRPRSLIISGPGLHSRDREALLDQSARIQAFRCSNSPTI